MLASQCMCYHGNPPNEYYGMAVSQRTRESISVCSLSVYMQDLKRKKEKKEETL